MIFNVKPFF